jgi:hypothetical protein
MAKPRRKRNYIDSCVQGSLSRRIIGHWLVFLSMAAVVSFVLQVLSNPFQPLAAHVRNLWWTHGPFLLVMVFLLPVFVMDTIKLSNRFAGPVYSLRRAMREVVQGKPPRKLRFRKNDFWHALADDYNALLLRLDLLSEDEELAAHREPLAVEKK